MQNYDFSQNEKIDDLSQEINIQAQNYIKPIRLSRIEASRLFPDEQLFDIMDSVFQASNIQETSKDILEVQGFFSQPKDFISKNFLLADSKLSIHRGFEESTENQVDSIKIKNEGADSSTYQDYDKNIPGYITKKVFRLMFQNHQRYIRKICLKYNVQYEEFNRFYQALKKRIYGPTSLSKMFKINKNDSLQIKMKVIFNVVYEKILRKNYLIYILKRGKMQLIQSYIQKKNKQLLYFAECSQD